MSLYECTRCRAVENTALGDYWQPKFDGRPVLCSECATGTWHGKFSKKLVSETNYVTNARGLLEPPGGWPPPKSNAQCAQNVGRETRPSQGEAAGIRSAGPADTANSGSVQGIDKRGGPITGENHPWRK